MRIVLIITFGMLALTELIMGIATTEEHHPKPKHVADVTGFLAFMVAAVAWPGSLWTVALAAAVGVICIGGGIALAASDKHADDEERLQREDAEANATLPAADMATVRAEAARIISPDPATRWNR